MDRAADLVARRRSTSSRPRIGIASGTWAFVACGSTTDLSRGLPVRYSPVASSLTDEADL